MDTNTATNTTPDAQSTGVYRASGDQLAQVTVDANPLRSLDQDIRRHWQAYQPTLYAALEAAGTLEATLQAQVRETKEAVLELVSSGTPLLEAYAQLREEFSILPAEAGLEEVDELTAIEREQDDADGEDDEGDEDEGDELSADAAEEMSE